MCTPSHNDLYFLSGDRNDAHFIFFRRGFQSVAISAEKKSNDEKSCFRFCRCASSLPRCNRFQTKECKMLAPAETVIERHSKWEEKYIRCTTDWLAISNLNSSLTTELIWWANGKSWRNNRNFRPHFLKKNVSPEKITWANQPFYFRRISISQEWHVEPKLKINF